MRRNGRSILLGIGLTVGLLVPALAPAQTVFTYSPSDAQSFVMPPSGHLTISVGTIVIIQENPAMDRVAVETKSFIVKFKPPQASEPKLVQASVDNQVVDVNVLRSDIDGEMEASVQIPVKAGNSPVLKMEWTTADQGNVEMSFDATPDTQTRNLHSQAKSIARRTVCRVKPAARKKTSVISVFFQ